MHGVTGYFPPTLVDDRPVFREHTKGEDRDKDPDVVSGRPFYLPAEMWDAYFKYLHLHPEQNKVFCEGFQVCTGHNCFVILTLIFSISLYRVEELLPSIGRAGWSAGGLRKVRNRRMELDEGEFGRAACGQRTCA